MPIIPQQAKRVEGSKRIYRFDQVKKKKQLQTRIGVEEEESSVAANSYSVCCLYQSVFIPGPSPSSIFDSTLSIHFNHMDNRLYINDEPRILHLDQFEPLILIRISV